jgi:hypothetical protein
MANSENNRVPSLVIVIPIYKVEFDLEEQRLVDRMFAVFSKRELTLVGPESIDLGYYKERYPSAKFITFQSTYFESVHGYSRLLLSKAFYEAFDDKEFLLISQPDVYVFRDDLDIWLQKPYDYVGAPWPSGFSVKVNIGRFANEAGGTLLTAFVGNGGFSLRRIKQCIKLLEHDKEVANWFSESGSNEDLFYGLVGSAAVSFILPTPIAASTFAMETHPESLYALNGHTLPIAAHAFRKYSPRFWEQIIHDFFRENTTKFY